MRKRTLLLSITAESRCIQMYSRNLVAMFRLAILRWPKTPIGRKHKSQDNWEERFYDRFRQRVRERGRQRPLKLPWSGRRISPGAHQIDTASRIGACWRSQPRPEN